MYEFIIPCCFWVGLFAFGFCFCLSSSLAQFALSQVSATLQVLHKPVRLHLHHEIKHARLVLGIEHAPEQSVLGRTVAVAQTEPRSCRNFSQSSSAGANCLDLLYLEVHVLETHELLSKTASDLWLHSRLYIGHLFSSHRTTARVCQKCGTQAHSVPWGHSCPANMPRRRGEDQARAEYLTQTVPSVLLWFSGIPKS